MSTSGCKLGSPAAQRAPRAKKEIYTSFATFLDQCQHRLGADRFFQGVGGLGGEGIPLRKS